MWTWRQLGYHDQPIGLLNTAGYYDPLLAFMQHTVDEGFLAPAQLQGIVVSADPVELLDRLHRASAASRAGDDYSRI